mgnify:CR=1 FL=1
MRKALAAALLLSVAACGDQPAPKMVEKKAVVELKVETPKADPNKVLALRVKRALEEDAKIQAAGIDVTASDGAVTLWGTAATEAEKRRAAQAAAKVEGVKSVDNRIAVVKGS